MNQWHKIVGFALASAAVQSTAANDGFNACLSNLQTQANAASIDPYLVNEVIPSIRQQKKVLRLDAKQPEFLQTFGNYLYTRVNDTRIKRGRKLYQERRAFLNKLTQQYGVPGHYLLAFWGLETNFGSYMGSMPTLDALATLACDPRRSKFFTTEFINALRLMQRESLSADQMQGSWAGAMGHAQFMPSTYLQYAVDGDHNGTVDLWRSEKDALASAANFLMQLGWKRGLRWGREVTLPDGFPYDKADRQKKRPLAEWTQAGVRQVNGHALPTADIDGAIIVPAGHEGPAFLVYDNFAVIMRWNRSESYAISVGHLADRIAGAEGLTRPPPKNQQALSRIDVTRWQEVLNAKGFNAGKPDGILGAATRAAVRAYEQQAGLIADGFPDNKTIEHLLADKLTGPDASNIGSNP